MGDVLNIPPELRECPQWVVWKLEKRDEKLTKVPYCAKNTKRRASPTDRDTWATFDEACAAAPSENGGIGFVFTKDDPFIGIDLDKCLTDGTLEPWAHQIVEKLKSYTEITPSGTGLHILIRGTLPEGRRRKGKIEMYDSGRFFTMTGDVLMDFADYGAEERTEEVAALYAELFADEPEPQSEPLATGPGFSGSDYELIERAKRSDNGSKFARLWEGDVTIFDGDHSRADMSLCTMLAFWTGRDAARIDRIFRQSGLMRPKWDSKRGNETYGQRTIREAIARCREVYVSGMEEADVEAYLEQFNGFAPGSIKSRVNTNAAEPDDGESDDAPQESSKSKRSTRKPYVTNAVRQVVDGEERPCYVSPQVMSATLFEGTGGWPKSANGMLFVRQDHREADEEFRLPDRRDVRFLVTTNALHAWIHENVDLHFTQSRTVRKGERHVSPVTKGEFYEHVISAAERYSAVELLPHHPPVEDVYYWECKLPEPTGEALKELRDHLNAETEEDRDLMIAALLTPGWGGPPGSRPAFVFTSMHGRGAGKTKTAELFAEIWGGFVSVSEDEDWQQVKTRLLSDESLTNRIVMIDNLKGRLSRSGLEAAITSVRIDGRRLYVGQASRPNLLTWYITANTPELSRDLSERSVVIKVGQPKHGFDFDGWRRKFVSENRPHIIADIMAVIRGDDQCDISKIPADRWRMWQRGILAKMPNGADLAAKIIDSRPEVDMDFGNAEEIAGVFRHMMQEAHRDPDHEQMAFTTKYVHEQMVDAGVCSKSDHPRRTTSWIKHMLDIPPLKGHLSYRVMKVNGQATRCWVWSNESCSESDHIPIYGGGNIE